MSFSRKGVGGVALCLLALTMFSHPGQAEPWRIKDFDVANFRLLNADQLMGITFDNGPGERAFNSAYIDTVLKGLPFDLERFGETMAPIHDKQIMEDHLKLTADFFERWDLPEPTLQPIVTKPDGSPAYRVYLVQNLAEGGDSVGGLYHLPNCIGDQTLNVILYNAPDMYVDQALSSYGLGTLSHELFHAVQLSTSLFDQGCRKAPTAWITEGTAEAVGFDVARAAIAAPIPNVTMPTWLAGARHYDAPLHRPRTNLEAYETSSFWRFMAEYYAYRFAGAPQPGPAPGPVHYGYIDSLFDRSASLLDDDIDTRPNSELDLLDAWIKATYPGKGLRDLYTLFVAGLPYQAAYRQDQWATGSVGVAIEKEKWLQDTFGQCPVIALTPDAPASAPMLFSVEEIAAACWRIDISGFNAGQRTDQVPVMAEVFGDEPELAQLAAGSGLLSDADSMMVNFYFHNGTSAPPVRVETKTVVEPNGSAEGDFSTAWTFPFEPKVPGSIVVANVAENAIDTQPIGALSIVFTALEEYASLGASEVDAKALADAINAPFELDLTHRRAIVMHERHEKSGHTYMGTGEAVGVERPCLLQLSGETERSQGAHFPNAITLALRTSGPIVPHRAYAIQSSKDISQLSDYQTNVVAASAQLNEANGDILDYDIQNGELIFDTIAGNYIRGHLTGDGIYREYSPQTLKYEVRRVQRIAAKFGIRVKAPMGPYKNRPYACLSSRG